MSLADLEIAACTPEPLNLNGFNPNAIIPHGLTIEHIKAAMRDFLDFLSFINVQLCTKNIPRLESFLMPANFSSMVGEFIVASIPKYCPTVVKNTYHNGHPDILPKGMYQGDSALHAPEGIEVKGSRHDRGWQGHNAEDVWLMVFVFESNTARDVGLGISPRPFKFRKVVGAKIDKSDWQFSGRSAATSRRTITASVTTSGYNKMEANWIYHRS
ncbi:MAG TPA: hypothetical protein HPP57_00650 [Deltaproteobacteria bacterium]|jgi:hypothetical protein|nr:hypothetical protein [Deltaproteobacteria bacterium]